MFKRISTAALVSAFMAGAAFAGPVIDFKAQMADAYASYRMALFATNSGDPGKSYEATTAFKEKWTAIIGTWAKNPPPHLAEDGRFPGTLEKVAKIAVRATGTIAEGNLGEAHERLEAIRDEIAEMNARSGIITYSDMMNDYHAHMEHVLNRDYGPEDSADAIADAGVLAWLAARLDERAPGDYLGNQEFVDSLKAVAQSVAGFSGAARSGDREAIAKAKAALKKPYAKLFLKFG